MSWKTLQVKFVLLLAVQAVLAMFMGSEPWGPG